MADAGISIVKLDKGTTRVWVRGTTGLYCHRMAEKAKRDLLIGSRKKTTAEKQTLKHDPIEEFRASMNVIDGLDDNTRVFMPATAFKSAMATAALEVPGVKKTQANRLVSILGEWVPIYGIPSLRLDVVRMADMSRTPDIRSRAYFPEWGTVIEIAYMKPALSEKTVLTLLENAGEIIGVGDFRQEKGKGSYGKFSIADERERGKPPFPAGMMDIAAQTQAIQTPASDNAETAELLELFEVEKAGRK